MPRTGPTLERHRAHHAAKLTDTCALFVQGVAAGSLPFRVGSRRTPTQPGDPQDIREGVVEWGFTFLWDAVVEPSDRIEWTDEAGNNLEAVIGEAERGNTWQVGLRCWGSEPKESSPWVSVVFWRYDPDTDDWTDERPAQVVQYRYEQRLPETVPVRFAPSTRTLDVLGKFVKREPFDVVQGDRFTMFGRAGVVDRVVPGQPQHREAHWRLDVGGTP
jgi:hypothetical protein